MTTQDPSSWIGRTESCDDTIDVGHVQRIALSLDAPAPAQGDALPLLWQWGLFINALPYRELGDDGHPRRGGFLPAADNRNSMWARSEDGRGGKEWGSRGRTRGLRD